MSRQVQQRALNCTVTSCLSLFSSFFLSFLPTISACAKKKIIFKGLFLQHDFNVVIHRYGKSLKPVGLACYRLTQTLTDDVSEERHGDVAIISTVVANREHTRTRHRNRVCRSKKKKSKANFLGSSFHSASSSYTDNCFVLSPNICRTFIMS